MNTKTTTSLGTTFRYAFISFLSIACIFSASGQKRVQQFDLHKTWAFEENKGQVKSDDPGDIPSYSGSENGANLYCYADKIRLQFLTKVKQAGQTGKSTQHSYNVTELSLHLVNASKNPVIETGEAQAAYSNYYNNDNPDGITGVHSFRKLIYKDVWPSIDMVLYSMPRGMKYSFVIRPGGNPSDIKLQWKGADKMHQNSDGGIAYVTNAFTMAESAPYTFNAEGKELVSSAKLEGEYITYSIGAYDKNSTITIDPTLNWGTFFGGEATDYIKTLTADSAENAYIGGEANSAKHIATPKAYLTTETNLFFARFDARGNLKWSTYYYGSYHCSLTADRKGTIFITGQITGNPTGFATKGAFQSTNKTTSYSNAFLSKFDSSGKRIWATYFGGTGNEDGYAITTDTTGNVIFAGTSTSSGMASSGAWRTKQSDLFVAKFSSSGKRLWSTYYGGDPANNTLYTAPYSITTDKAGNIFLTGSTTKSSGFTSTGGWQTTKSGKTATQDAFLARFTPGGALSWGTYYGDYQGGSASGVAADDRGNVYMAGGVGGKGGDTVVTKGSFEDTFSTNIGGCIIKFDSLGNRVWGTFYNGSCEDICYNNTGVIHFGGYSPAAVGVATTDAYQATKGSIYFATFDTSGKRIYGTYYGGKYSSGYIYNIASDGVDAVYITGNTTEDTGFGTAGAYQTANYDKNSGDGFLAKFSCPPPVVRGGAVLCGKSSTIYSTPRHSGSAYQWKIKGGTILSGQNTDSVKVDWGTAKYGSLSVVETSKCLDSASQDITISPLPKPQIFGDSTLCFNVVGIYNAVDTAARKLVWGSKYGKILFGLRQDTVYVHYASAGKDMLKVIETNSVGCRDSVFRNVIIHPVPDANWKTNIDSSHNSNIFAADDSTFSTYIWNFGDGSAAYSNKTSHSYNHADTFNVSLKVYDNFSCSSEKDSTIVVSLFTGLQNIIGTDASLNIYPNPFKDKLIIQYSLVKDTRVSISMEDIFGKQIISLDDKYAQQGNYSMILDTEKYHIAPGIYFLKILLDGKATSKKIVKVD